MFKSFRLVIAAILFIITMILLIFYFNYKINNQIDSLDYIIIQLSLIIIFNLFFYSFVFIFDFNLYRRIFLIILVFVTSIWLYEMISWAYFDLTPISLEYGIFWETFMILSFSIIAQGLIFYIIYHIRKNTIKFNDSKIFGRYHIHEGFVGIIFIILAIILFIFRSRLLFLTDILWKRLGLIFWFIQILLFIFLYLGSFFFFRDINDILKLKLIEKKESKTSQNKEHNSNDFQKINYEDIHFFKLPKIAFYPFGLLFTILSLYLIIYGKSFINIDLIVLENESIILFGYFLCFSGSAMIGRDWLRLLKKIYPEIYQKIEKEVKKIKTDYGFKAI